MTLLLADLLNKEAAAGLLNGESLWAGVSPVLGRYLVTFLIASIYWVSHHNECRLARRSDRVLLWFNLLFLATVACVPVSMAILGHVFDPPPEGVLHPVDSNERVWRGLLMYFANAIAIGVSLSLFFLWMWRTGLEPDKTRFFWEAVVKNAFLPVAYTFLLVHGWVNKALPVEEHLSWLIAIPPLAYLLMTVATSLLLAGTERGDRWGRWLSRWRRLLLVAGMVILGGGVALGVVGTIPRLLLVCGGEVLVVVWAFLHSRRGVVPETSLP